MDHQTPKGLGGLLAAQTTPPRLKAWRLAMYAALAAAAALGLVIPNHHPHFVYDAKPFFWPVFGLGLGLALVFLAKRVVQPVIKRPEDHYGDI
jgi:peptidoglycan/LPS O-acetylase OafA/YrhL